MPVCCISHVIFLMFSEVVMLCMKAILIQLLVEKNHLLPKYAFILNNGNSCIWIHEEFRLLFQWMYFRYSLEHIYVLLCVHMCRKNRRLMFSRPCKTAWRYKQGQIMLLMFSSPCVQSIWNIYLEFWITECFQVLFLSLLKQLNTETRP